MKIEKIKEVYRITRGDERCIIELDVRDYSYTSLKVRTERNSDIIQEAVKSILKKTSLILIAVLMYSCSYKRFEIISVDKNIITVLDCIDSTYKLLYTTSDTLMPGRIIETY